jgi:ribosomal protein S18 acetylase RimI-like enzyme
MNKILSLSELSADDKVKILSQVEEIFFLSTSLKVFSSTEKKQAFYKRWCEDYQTLYPNEFFILLSDEKVLGYLSGCLDSSSALEVLSVPGFAIFQDLFTEFPAHLHINFHPEARGKGFGSLLIKHFINLVNEKHLSGLHLITSPDAINVSFYQRLGFSHTETRLFNAMPLYFMGHKNGP